MLFDKHLDCTHLPLQYQHNYSCEILSLNLTALFTVYQIVNLFSVCSLRAWAPCVCSGAVLLLTEYALTLSDVSTRIKEHLETMHFTLNFDPLVE